MPATIMTPSRALLPILTCLTFLALGLLVACGGDDEPKGQIGQLSDPAAAPTAPPWEQPPEVAILDPNAIQPIGQASPTATPAPEGGAPGVCGPKYTIESGDTFSSIAEKCGTTTQAMRDANPGVDPLTIKAGQQVNVPASAPSPSP